MAHVGIKWSRDRWRHATPKGQARDRWPQYAQSPNISQTAGMFVTVAVFRDFVYFWPTSFSPSLPCLICLQIVAAASSAHVGAALRGSGALLKTVRSWLSKLHIVIWEWLHSIRNLAMQQTSVSVLCCRLESVEIGFTVFAVIMGLFAILLFAFSVLAESRTRQNIYSGVSCIMGGRLAALFVNTHSLLYHCKLAIRQIFDHITCRNKKAVLSQRWPRNARYINGSYEPLRRYGHSKLS